MFDAMAPSPVFSFEHSAKLPGPDAVRLIIRIGRLETSHPLHSGASPAPIRTDGNEDKIGS
jgi:hypothetical protein